VGCAFSPAAAPRPSPDQDDEDWEEELQVKLDQLRALLGSLDPLGEGAVHPDDEEEIQQFEKKRRSVSMKGRVVRLTIVCTQLASLNQPDRVYQPDSNESQQSTTDSQLDGEMLADEDCSQTPQGSAHPGSLDRLRAPPGSFGSPVVPRMVLPEEPLSTGAAAASSSSHKAGPCVGRPAELAAAGLSTKQGLKDVSALAHHAPGKANSLFEEQQAIAPEPTSHGNIVAKSKEVTDSIFETSGNLNETIEVVSHMLERSEMRPILEHLGYSQMATASDSMIVTAIAAFIEKHLYSGGTRTKEAQAAHNLLLKAASSAELLEDRLISEAARRLGVRIATYRHLLDSRLKMDTEVEHGVEVGALLKVSRLRRKDAADDEAELFDNWSHEVCRYDSTQTTGGKKVRRFGDAKVDGKVIFEEHERRTLPCNRKELSERFLESAEYKAFMERTNSNTLHFSFFQKRICSCMVDEKMTQCADSIDTQFNVLFATWLKLKQEWHEGETCSKAGCVCRQQGFLKISSRTELWAFLFRGQCAPKLDPTRSLPRDVAPHAQLDYACVAAECDKKGCLKDKLELWGKCPVQNKKGSETEISSKKWTPVPRSKAKTPGDDDGDDDYDPAAKGEKWSKEMLPFQSSRPEFMLLLLASVEVAARPVPSEYPLAIHL